MKMRLLASTLLLAGCGGPDPAPEPVEANQAEAASAPAQPSAADDGRVECARGGAVAFERVCTIERSDSAQGRIITLRSADGGFRRLLITRDGRGVVAADGAEAARVTPLSADLIEVAVGRDRYRLPATVRQ